MKWPLITLSKVAAISAGQSAPNLNEFNKENGLPFIRAGHLEMLIRGFPTVNLPKISIEVANKHRLKIIDSGCILFAKSGMSASLNRILLIESPCYYVSHLASVKPNNEILDSRFCKYFLEHYSPSRLIKDSAYPSIGLSDIEKIQIPLPPLPIQKRIADILDAADALRKKDEALLKKYDELAQAIFIDMFGDPVKNEKGWEVKKINNCIIQKPDNGFFAKNEHYFEGGTPIVWISNFIDKTYISQSSLKRVKTNPSDSKYYLKYGDALFCRSSLTLDGIGKCSIAPMNLKEPTIFECHIIRLQFDLKKIVPEYFRFLSDTKYFRNKIMKSAKTSTMTTISQEGITDIEIPIPALNIQLQFRDKVKIFEKLKTQSVKTHYDTEELFSTILNKAFSGELVS